jgi:hypothetical protein
MVNKIAAAWLAVSAVGMALYVIAFVIDIASANPVGPYAGWNLYLSLSLLAWVMAGFFSVCIIGIWELWK